MKKIEKTSLCVLCTLLLHCATHSAYGQNTNYPYITEYDGTMREQVHKMTIDSEPQGARVIINDKSYGVTPLEVQVPVKVWTVLDTSKSDEFARKTAHIHGDTFMALFRVNMIDPANRYRTEKSTTIKVKLIKENHLSEYKEIKMQKDGYPSDVFMVLEKDPDAVAQVPAAVNSNTSVAQNTNVTQQQVNTNNVSNTTTYNLSNGSQSGNNQMSNQSQSDMLNRSIRFNIDSTPRGARVFWRVISSITNEVSGSNEMWLGNTPIEVNRTFNIPGLTYENSRHIQIEIKVRQNGYIDQTRTFNLRQAIDMQDISAYYDLVPAQ